MQQLPVSVDLSGSQDRAEARQWSSIRREQQKLSCALARVGLLLGLNS